jgi:AraC family transcriptional regulator of arabinose operon
LYEVPAPTTRDTRISRAIGQMHCRLGSRIRVDVLAASVHLSPSHFRHLFAAQTGTSPTRYLTRLRLRRARLLIERTFLTIEEVMVVVGYGDRRHFSKDFLRLYGVSPSALRATDVATALPSRAPRDGHWRFHGRGSSFGSHE